MKIFITREQAVWERETFEVEVPDDIANGAPDDDEAQDLLAEAIHEAVRKYTGYCDDPNYRLETLDDPVYGIDTRVVAELPDGREMEVAP